MVVFGADRAALKRLAEQDHIDENCIMDKKSGIRSKVNCRNGLYTYNIWQKRRIDVATVDKDSCGLQDLDDEDAAWRPF